METKKDDPIVDKRTEYMDNADRAKLDFAFSLSKRHFGMELIRIRLEETTRSSIKLSIIAMNIDKLAKTLFVPKYSSEIFKVQLRNKGIDLAVYSA